VLAYPDTPLHEVMRATAARHPDRAALTFKGVTLSFASFDRESNKVANALASLGLEKGDRLSLFVPNCPEHELAFYAAAKLGAIACPINPSCREREITYQVNDSGATIMLTHSALWPVVDACRDRLESVRHYVLLGDSVGAVPGVIRYATLVDAASPAPPDVRVEPHDIVALPYSSGTTGLPKGVMLTHQNLVCNHMQMGTASEIGPDDAYPVYLPLSHIYGVVLMGVAMWSGAHQVLMERFDLEAVVEAIQQHRATRLYVVPPVLLALANAPGLHAGQFRTIEFALNAAAPLAPDIARRVEQRLGFHVLQAYGLTEASPDTHHSPVDPKRVKLESVGIPVADTEQCVVDLETGAVLPPGATGEILVRGPQVMKGYWKAPEETARVLSGGWLHTGDIGWVDEDGYAFVVDRKKEMIKYKSFSIAPAELEATLLEHPHVADCAVIGIPDEEAGEVPRAYVVAQKGEGLDVEALARFCATRLAGYKTIRQWQIVDSIPRTPSGKILRRVLKQQALAAHDTPRRRGTEQNL
jgi:long-chain acyl-CoA synthetase